ncbi:MAG: universal stress protein [Deltaproteobacteria bacterium]|nr:universal stress protein [Deltaproteobacteria bacterium]
MELHKILLCTDGDEQAVKAEDFAVGIAKSTGAFICSLYVINPFLKKFADEIYAIGRDEYRDYIDRTLHNEGNKVLNKFQAKACNQEVKVIPKMRYGSPEKEILQEMEDGGYDLVVIGSKFLGSWRKRFESYNLPEKVFKKTQSSVVFVR